MLMDKTTEMVAHMIGIFHTSVEEIRLREVYDKFKALKAEALDNGKIDAIAVSFKAGYRLEGFAPGIKYKPPYLEEGTSSPINPLHTASGIFVPGISVGSLDFQVPQFFASLYWGGGSGKPTLEPPASVVVVTFQSNFLYDDDLLLQGDGTTVFTDPTELLEQLQHYQTVATAIAAPADAEILVPGETAGADAIVLHNKIGLVEASTLTGVAASVLHGAEAMGLHLNGEVVEKLDSLEDVMPAYHASKAEGGEGSSGADASEEGAEGESGAEEHDWPDAFEGLDNDGATGDDFHIEAGHHIVTGGNTMVNEVAINSAWLDAPMIAVMGDVVNLEVIAQVNVLVNHDSGMTGGPAASAVLNGAGMTFTSSAPEEDEGEETAAEPAGGGLPSNWVVTRIDGDVVSFNHVNQYNFQTDHDRAEVCFHSSNTYIAMGDNSLVNVANLGELGFGYDLIFIGGDMISVNWISQINVLIDNDTVTYSGLSPSVASGDDNLLYNSAHISGSGLDSHDEMSTGMKGISKALGEGDEGFKSDPGYAPVFEGLDVLRVLYVEGDLTTVNWIKQTNILGDSDQVHLAMDNLEKESGAEVTVTAGSNAVVNLASINEYGVDSEVAVGGEVYDDALLYQAELIDTDADPLGVDLSGLASEAVAFLAEDMLSPEIGTEQEAILPTAPEDTSSSDVMQTMLA